MRKLIFLLSIVIMTECGKIEPWWPGWGQSSTTGMSQPTQGCQKDVTVHYKNNCDMNLLVYFIEVNPGTTVICESLDYRGTLEINQSNTFTIHKGKVGFFAFAENEEGKCSAAHRKAEAWINCTQASGDDAYFNSCQ